jgi:6-phosphogluconate dehydrogenase-like protein
MSVWSVSAIWDTLFAVNLIEDGYQVTVYDRNPERTTALRASGASAATRLGDLAACDVVLTSLPDDDALAAVALGPSGLVGILSPTAAHISTSTVSPTLSRSIAEEHARHRRHEFRPDRVFDGLPQNRIDLEHRGSVNFPSHDPANRRQLVRPPRAPQSNIGFGTIKYPAQREMNYVFAVVVASKSLELLDCIKILLKTRRSELRIILAQIVSRESGLARHSAR